MSIAEIARRAAALEQENRRLLILQALKEDRDYRINDRELQAIARITGRSLSLDELHAELNWLEDNDLVELERLDSIVIARLKHRGLEIVDGMAIVPGVARPALDL